MPALPIHFFQKHQVNLGHLQICLGYITSESESMSRIYLWLGKVPLTCPNINIHATFHIGIKKAFRNFYEDANLHLNILF